MSLTARILISMGAGIFFGSVLNFVNIQGLLSEGLNLWLHQYLVEGFFDGIGRIFIASLKLLVVPLVFVSLVCGISSLSASTRMGPIAGKTLLFYMLTTAIAITLALIVAVLVQPGMGIELAGSANYIAKQAPPLKMYWSIFFLLIRFGRWRKGKCCR